MTRIGPSETVASLYTDHAREGHKRGGMKMIPPASRITAPARPAVSQKKPHSRPREAPA